MDWAAFKPLNRWEKVGVGVFVLLFGIFGGLVEVKSAFLTRRMGDLDVFLRAAWAVRNDADLYAITNDNDWHYLYPPLYAILMTPLADPPKGADATGYVPYAASVAICYLLNVLCLLIGVHVLASALEERVLDSGQPAYCRRWWSLRLWPILVCLMPIGHTLIRGQVNLVVLALLCAAMAGWIRGQNTRAGVWLSFAICIKVIPAYLLVYPLWKRDVRALAGCAIGLLVGLVLIPLGAFGPTRTVTVYETYAKVFLGPHLNVVQDDRTTEELASTDTIGVKNALHNWTYPDAAHRPTEMHVAGKAAYVLLGFAMTFLTLWPRSQSGPSAGSGIATTQEVTQLGGLVLLMAIFSPVCHRHYLMFCLPIVMTMLAAIWKNRPTVHVPWLLTSGFIVFNVGMALGYLPSLEAAMRDSCGPLFGTFPLWVLPVAQMWRGWHFTISPVAQQAA